MKFGNRILRRAAAALGIVAIVSAGLVTAPTAAVAAQHEGIIVSDLTFDPDNRQIKVGETLRIEGTWDATNIIPKKGDSFTIGLPKELQAVGLNDFPLLGKNELGKTEEWGFCTVNDEQSALTCVLSDLVEARPFDVSGTFGFDVKAVLATEEVELEFDLNGKAGPVELPGGGGIETDLTAPEPWDKQGWMSEDGLSVQWQISLPGDRLADAQTLTVDEVLSSNHALCEPIDIRLTQYRTNGETFDRTASIEHQPGADGQHFSYLLTEPTEGWDEYSTYTISYSTCPTSGELDPAGTEYLNSASIEIWGESKDGVGVTQDWDFTGEVEKYGYVLQGADRNGKLGWVIKADGDVLAGQNPFTLTDTLKGDHALCTDTVSGLQIMEQYGPSSNSKSVYVTDQLEITNTGGTGEGDTDFTVSIAVKPGSDFEFKPHPYVYTVSYQTCATADGLPEPGTTYSNEASIGGKVVTSNEVPTPGFDDRKSGNINRNKVTIDGVEYPAQSTLNWNITVPGHKLDEVVSELVVTDTLDDSQLVCLGESDDLAKRLNLSVLAKDQVKDGGLKTVDLTDSVSVALEGNTITMTVPQPTLPLPNGSDVTGFNKEYQYVFTYTSCTASGGMDQVGTTYGNKALVAGTEYATSVTQENKGSGTGQGVARGSVSVKKSLAPTTGAAFVPKDATFTVLGKEIAPSGDIANEFTLTLPIDGTEVSGPNPRGKGWAIELSEIQLPSYPGVVFGTPKFTATEGVTVSDDGQTARAALSPATNIGVELENRAMLGQVTVVKAVDGGAAHLVDPDYAYQVTAKIDTSALGADFPAQPDRTFDLVAGQPVTLDDLPIGAVVTFVEAVPADSDELTWAADPTIDPLSVTVDASHVTTPAAVTITNHVERTVSTFSLSKSVTGEQAANPAVPTEVTVNATWTEDGVDHEKTLTLPTDGTEVAFGEQLLIGTKVTLTEVVPADGQSIAWGAPVWAGTGVEIDGDSAVVTITRDTAAHVSLENHAATSTAGISILKGLAGEAVGEVDPSTEFPVTATWIDAKGIEQTVDLMINAVTPIDLGVDLPAGTVVTITEGTQPAFDTVIWGDIVISGTGVTDNGGGSATVIVSDQQGDATLVTVVNEATWAPGTLSVNKTVTGIAPGHADIPETVTVIATWFDDQLQEWSQELTLPTDGTVVDLGLDLPHGTVVTLSEVAPEGTPRLSWDAPVWSGDVTVTDEGDAVVTVQAAGNAQVALTNNATELLGSLDITKALDGNGAESLPKGTTFPVTVTWTNLMGEEQTVTTEVIPGKTTTVEGIALGTKVHVTEGEAKLPGTVRWESGTWSATGDHVTLTAGANASATVEVTGDAGTTAELTLTNTLTKVDDLASTGQAMNIAAIVLVAFAAIGAGAWFMRRNARKSAA